jgi:hypothetical protein
MEPLLDKIEKLCRENCIIMHIWHEGMPVNLLYLKSIINTTADFNIYLTLPSIIGSEWDGKFNSLSSLWTISVEMLLNPRFQEKFEYEFFQRLIYKTFRT